MRKLKCCLACSLLVGFVGSVEAQSPEKCIAATEYVLSHSLPPSSSHDWSAWNLVASCGSSRGIDTFVGALSLSQITSETDPTKLYSLFAIFDGRLDASLFAAYASAVSSNGGSDAFRIAAMRALVGMVEPDIEIRLPPVGSAQPSCGTAGRMYGRDRASSTLPADAFERVIATVSDVTTNGTAPRVKLAATCWQALLERQLPIGAHDISISYVCGNIFRVKNKNHNPNGVDLKYVVGNNSDSGEFGVPGKGTYDLKVSDSGTVSIYLGRTLIGSQANGGAVCK